MKIGILTYSCSDNVGAVLQCYALKTYIECLGHEVTVIDYRPYYLLDSYGVFHNPIDYSRRHGLYRALTRVRADVLHYSVNRERTKEFNAFRSRMLKMPSGGDTHYHTNADLVDTCDLYDAIIAGSDQIWRMVSDNVQIDEAFCLEFAKDAPVKKIAYAASIGKISRSQDMCFKTYLSNFQSISVRESEAKAYLDSLGIANISCVMDPVFLNRSEIYPAQKSILPNNLREGEYVFVYVLENDTRVVQAVNEYLDYHPFDEVVYYSRERMVFSKKAKRFKALSPELFISLIKYSSAVITNSFHGTAFSIIYSKDIYSIPHTQTGGRVRSLLSSLNLENRITEHGKIDEESINWERVGYLLNNEIHKSQDFLIQAIG